jgi:hypothetical protein
MQKRLNHEDFRRFEETAVVSGFYETARDAKITKDATPARFAR